MILKPKQDDKLDEIINKSKDYEMKLTSEQVLHAYELRKANNSLPNQIKQDKRQKKINYKLAMISSLSLALIITTITIGCVYSQNNNDIVYTNISNNIDLLKDKNVNKSIGKELLMFNFNFDNDSTNATKTLRSVLNDSFDIDVGKMFNNIVNGFQKVSQIFLNGLFDFNEIEVTNKHLTKPVTFDGVQFDNALNFRYMLLVDFTYYYSSNENVDYGYTLIDTGILQKTPFKTIISTVVDNNSNSKYLDLTLSNKDFYFSINNAECKSIEDSVYSYSTYFSEKDFLDNNPYRSFYAKFDSSGKDSCYNIIESNNYLIKYFDISSNIFNLIKCTFNVDYLDLINEHEPTRFNDVKLSGTGNNLSYDFGHNVIIKPNK